MESDVRLAPIVEKIEKYSSHILPKEAFVGCIAENIAIVKRTLDNDFIIGDIVGFKKEIKEIFDLCKQNISGKTAQYI